MTEHQIEKISQSWTEFLSLQRHLRDVDQFTEYFQQDLRVIAVASNHDGADMRLELQEFALPGKYFEAFLHSYKTNIKEKLEFLSGEFENL